MLINFKQKCLFFIIFVFLLFSFFIRFVFYYICFLLYLFFIIFVFYNFFSFTFIGFTTVHPQHDLVRADSQRLDVLLGSWQSFANDFIQIKKPINQRWECTSYPSGAKLFCRIHTLETCKPVLLYKMLQSLLLMTICIPKRCATVT